MAERVVLCAVDLGPLSRRVFYHAAGMARVLQARLRVLHVDADTSPAGHARVFSACQGLAPYEVNLELGDIMVRAGRVADVIHREARHLGALLLVIGSRGHGGLAKLLLGSTSGSVLRDAPVPTLLVPPTDMDIVGLGNVRPLNCGPILAAVDLTTDSQLQLRLASELAELAAQSLLLMTVAGHRMSDHDAAQALRQAGESLAPVKPRAFIVRRGAVGEEIARCASAEGAGLVVMGLDRRPRVRTGSVASAVLSTGRAFVMAVPPDTEADNTEADL
jgi:nucleotide-binding universal stress UspA family protein